ncbi:MAG TPA: DnaJ domain-containing protein [Bacteroidales bacterium]|nr:DnaJ domain-containing protein [Bacteroidales bacterium]HSA43203.1 DnaJ domain-containing protein [Bacteroidales bacterium]
MGKYTKWIAGGLGWALGGPIGGILGFVFGSMVDGMTTARYEHQPTGPGDFSASLLVLSAAVMKADGRVTKAELEYVKTFFIRNFGLEKAAEDMLLLRGILKQDINLAAVCGQIRQYMAYPERLQLLHYLYGIALADALAGTSELKVIGEISRLLGVSANDMASLQAMFVKDAASAYKILEISQEATDEEVKKAYRKMALKYHPDKVGHLGDDVRKAAEEKFREVQEAYEQIKKQRNLN